MLRRWERVFNTWTDAPALHIPTRPLPYHGNSTCQMGFCLPRSLHTRAEENLPFSLELHTWKVQPRVRPLFLVA